MHALVLVAALAQTPPAPWEEVVRPIPDLTRRATAILVGTGEVKRQVGVTAFVVLRRQRTLKGSVAGWVDDVKRFEVLWEARWDPGPFSGSVHGLWFLERDAQGHWFILPPLRHPGQPQDIAIPLPRDRPQRSEPPTPAIDAVTDELWAAAHASDPRMVDRAQEALETILGPTDPLSSFVAARWRPKGDSAASAYTHWPALGPRHWRICATARLARTWQALRLERLARWLRAHPRGDPPEEVWRHLCILRDAEGLPIVARLLDARLGRSKLDACLADAVASFPIEPSLPLLGRLLERPEERIRHAAIQGLRLHATRPSPWADDGRLRLPASGEPAPPPLSTDDLPGQVAHWRTWLAQHLAAGHPSALPWPIPSTSDLDGPRDVALGWGERQTIAFRGHTPYDSFLFESWPTQWEPPVGCFVGVDQPRQGAWVAATVVDCDPVNGRASVEVESHLCQGCRATIRFSMQDAWAQRATAETLVLEPPPPTTTPLSPWLAPPRPSPPTPLSPWLEPPRSTPSPGFSPWLERPK